MPNRSAWLHLWSRPPSLTRSPDPQEGAPPFLQNHTTAYPVTLTVEEACQLRVLFDTELDAIAVSGGNCRVAQVRHSRAREN
jgi:hypothetical protein